MAIPQESFEEIVNDLKNIYYKVRYDSDLTSDLRNKILHILVIAMEEIYYINDWETQ